MRPIRLFPVIILAVVVSWAWAQDEFSALQKYKILEPTVQKAQKFFEQDKIKKCEAELDRCFQSLADHHDAHFLKAQILYKQGDFSAALEQIEEAKAGYIHVSQLIQKFKMKNAVQQMDEVQDLKDILPDLRALNAQTNCQRGIWSTDISMDENKINEDQRNQHSIMNGTRSLVPAEYDYFAGNCLFKLKRYAEAEAQYKSEIGTDPKHAKAYNNLLNILYMEKRIADAREVLTLAEANKAAVHPGLKKAILDAGR
jgi:tetratricopeptide (TPR) repeat protein